MVCTDEECLLGPLMLSPFLDSVGKLMAIIFYEEGEGNVAVILQIRVFK